MEYGIYVTQFMNSGKKYLTPLCMLEASLEALMTAAAGSCSLSSLWSLKKTGIKSAAGG